MQDFDYEDDEVIEPSATRRWIIRIALIVSGILLLEAALWVAAPIAHPYRAESETTQQDHLISPHLRTPFQVAWNVHVEERFAPGQTIFRPDPESMPGMKSPSRFTINEFGMRSARLKSIPKPDGVVRVFCIGGSTTECLYLDDEDTWPEVVRTKLIEHHVASDSIDVINAGISGDTTRDHINVLAHRVIPFSPDMVVFLVGTNDLAMCQEEGYDILRRDDRSRRLHSCPRPNDARYFAKLFLGDISQMFRRAIDIKQRLTRRDSAGNAIQDLEGRWVQNIDSPAPTGSVANLSTDEYAQNLASLIGICRAHDVIPVFCTQALVKMTEGMSAFNQVTKRVGEAHDVLVIDLAEKISGRPEWFYDTVHYNVLGAKQVGEVVASELIQNAKISRQFRLLESAAE